MADVGSRPEPQPRAADLTPEQAKLVESVRPPIRRLARNMVRRKGFGDPEDLEQIGLEIACKRAGEFRPGEAQFFTFIFKQVRRAMLDAINADKRQRRLAQACQRATEQVLDSIEVGDMLEEDSEARATRHDDARYAIIGAAVIGMCARPRTPEQIALDEEERAAAEARVKLVLEPLDPIDRQLVVLCTMQDVKVADAARALGLEYHPARYRYIKAMAAVGRKLGAKPSAASS